MMQEAQERGMNLGNPGSFDYEQMQIVVVKVYVFDTYKAVDKDFYLNFFGDDVREVGDNLAIVTDEQITQIEQNPRFEIEKVNMLSNNNNILEDKPTDIYNENKNVSDDLANMLEDFENKVDIDESTLTK